MDLSCNSSTETRLIDALTEVFELEPRQGLAVSTRAILQITNHMAELGALSYDQRTMDEALIRLARVQAELTDLAESLEEFRREVHRRAVH